MEVEQIGALIPIVAILSCVGFAFVWLRYQELKAANRQNKGLASAAEEEKHRLELRVQTLEQIITDGGLQTAAQIEALRTPLPARQRELHVQKESS